jgi:hypothetical protein
VDLLEAGDRLAACKANMQPIGLTLKRTRKKYGIARYGELMLIHRCVECGSVSVNRIAADDDAALIFDIYRGSFQLDTHVKIELAISGVNALGIVEGNIVQAQLYGKMHYEQEG